MGGRGIHLGEARTISNSEDMMRISDSVSSWKIDVNLGDLWDYETNETNDEYHGTNDETNETIDENIARNC